MPNPDCTATDPDRPGEKHSSENSTRNASRSQEERLLAQDRMAFLLGLLLAAILLAIGLWRPK